MSSAPAVLAATTAKAPDIDWASLSPIVALLGGSVIVLLLGLFSSSAIRTKLVPGLSVVAMLAAAGLAIWRWDEPRSIISGALRVDNLTVALTVLLAIAGVAAVLMAWRGVAPREAGHGEFHALVLSSLAGMVTLIAAQNLVSVFLGYELLSIPLYVLCATELRREGSLESGLKYLILGSIGSATLLYGSAFVYGATGSTDFGGIARALDSVTVAEDGILLTGVALVIVGLAFKASIAPFHQWTPDVYEGAPTPVTAFMAVATKVAALGVFLRIFDVALIDVVDVWAPALAALALVTIVVGNVGAIGQRSVKRMLAYSSVAQAGYLLAGVVVSSQLGVAATVFYLGAYAVMNLAVFAVVIARERETGLGDSLDALNGLGRDHPVLAWSMTIGLLSLAGFPATGGFFGKVSIIRALVDGGFTWLGVVIVLGSAASLAYYLRTVAAIWMGGRDEAPVTTGLLPRTAAGRPVIAGGSPELDATASETARHRPAGSGADVGAASTIRARPQAELLIVAVVCAAATLLLGVYPGPFFDLARDVGQSFTHIL